jgi:glycosyltransferase involved in cell wall biosynthesis
MSITVCHVCSGNVDDDARAFDRACVSLAAEGYDVHLVAKSRQTQPYRRQGVTIHPVPAYSSRLARMMGRKRVAELAASLHPDIYQVHEPELLAAVLKRAGSRPVIWDVREPYVELISTKHWIPRPIRPLVRATWDLSERSMVRRCAAVVAVSKWVAERYYSLNNRVVIIANFPRLPADGAQPSHSPRRPNVMVYTGLMCPDRFGFEMLEAMAILKRKAIAISLELAGSPISQAYFDDFIREAERLGVRGDITCHGQIPLEETIQLQQTCGIGVIPNRLFPGTQFGFAVKMFEFMMHGLPLVYSDIPNFRLIAGESDAGIAVDPAQPQQIADALEKLVTDPALARRLGENGRRAVYERLNWNVEWPKLRDLYVELVGRPGSHGG